MQSISPVETTTADGSTQPVDLPLLNEREAAAHLGVSIRTLQDKRLRGGGPRFVKIFRSVKYRRADLDAFVEANLRNHTSEGRA